jgi:Acyltransferase
MTTRLHRIFFEGEHGAFYRRAQEWIEVRLAQLLFNAWPISETGNVLSSLSYAGELADAGFSPLIFPEGREVPEGEMGQFRRGIGVFARELRLPVVPCYLEGTGAVLPSGAYWPRAARLRVVFGAALMIEADADAAKVTERIEQAVRELAPARHWSRRSARSTGGRRAGARADEMKRARLPTELTSSMRRDLMTPETPSHDFIPRLLFLETFRRPLQRKNPSRGAAVDSPRSG